MPSCLHQVLLHLNQGNHIQYQILLRQKNVSEFSPEFSDFGSLKYLLASFYTDESYYLSFFEN